jgi:RNA polymerase sigma-70 factor, ECF subfamily
MATEMVPVAPANMTSAKVLPLIAPREEKPHDGSELSLIQRAQRGEDRAFATLFQFHKRTVLSVCLRMTGNMADAEDLTQETFLRMFRSINSFRGDSAFSTWLYRIAVNTVLMNLRRRKKALVSLDEPVSTGDSPSRKRDQGKTDPSLNGAIDRIALRRAAARLPAGCGQVFHLFEVEGYQHHEIAQRLRCSIGNSKSQLHKARLKMRNVFFTEKEHPLVGLDAAQASLPEHRTYKTDHIAKVKSDILIAESQHYEPPEITSGANAKKQKSFSS